MNQIRSGIQAAGGAPRFGSVMARAPFSVVGVSSWRGLAVAAVAALALSGLATFVQAQGDDAPGLGEDVVFETSVAVVETVDGQVRAFEVEVADTPTRRSRGLMFRTEMADAAGMLFIFQTPAIQSFWMHNTLLPLDIIYFSPEGELLNTRAEARPLDRTGLPSAGASQFVLEINAGLAAELGLGRGAQLRSPALEAYGLGFVEGDQAAVDALAAETAAEDLDGSETAE